MRWSIHSAESSGTALELPPYKARNEYVMNVYDCEHHEEWPKAKTPFQLSTYCSTQTTRVCASWLWVGQSYIEYVHTMMFTHYLEVAHLQEQKKGQSLLFLLTKHPIDATRTSLVLTYNCVTQGKNATVLTWQFSPKLLFPQLAFSTTIL